MGSWKERKRVRVVLLTNRSGNELLIFVVLMNKHRFHKSDFFSEEEELNTISKAINMQTLFKPINSLRQLTILGSSGDICFLLHNGFHLSNTTANVFCAYQFIHTITLGESFLFKNLLSKSLHL